jgi:CheY-like chemotaxis protein
VAVILSADDDPDIRLLVKRILRAAGHRVILAADGQAAVESALADDVDLVILDVEMPRMRGLDVCRIIRDDPRTSHLPVIIASGSLVPPYDDVHEAGATACIAKPFGPAQLRAVVADQLAQPAPDGVGQR